MSFWLLFFVVLAIIAFGFNLYEQISNLIKSNPKNIIPLLIGMVIGYFIFFT